MAASAVDKVFDELGKMTVLDLVELKKKIEEEWGVTAAAPVAVAAPGAAPAAAGDGAGAEEKTEFDVVLTAAGDGSGNTTVNWSSLQFSIDNNLDGFRGFPNPALGTTLDVHDVFRRVREATILFREGRCRVVGDHEPRVDPGSRSKEGRQAFRASRVEHAVDPALRDRTYLRGGDGQEVEDEGEGLPVKVTNTLDPSVRPSLLRLTSIAIVN